MRRRFALLLVCLALPPVASPAVSGAAAGKAAVARLVDCDPAGRTAGFETDMRALPGTSRMQLRFTLQARGGDEKWARVHAPGFERWITALPGRVRWIYEKRLESLPPGAYRMQVRFRWRDAAGAVLKSATRRTRSCRLPDPRPDLVPLGVEVRDGPAEDRREYVVTVANEGRSAARESMAALTVDGVPLDDRPIGALEPGERAVATFVGPPCPAGGVLVAGADSTGVVEEAVEADDVLTVPCGP